MKRIAILLMLTPACGQQPSPPEAVTARPAALVRINDETLSEEQFAQYSELAAAREGARSRLNLLAEFVQSRLLLQAARRAGVSGAPDEVDRFLETIGPLENADNERLRAEVEAYLIMQRYIREKISPEITLTLQDALDYYAGHEADFVVGHRARASEILVETHREARELADRLAGADIRTFQATARERSIGATSEAGGNLGYFEEGDLPPDFERFIFALRPGQVSGVFPSPHGYHLFLLEEWIPAHAQKFHEVQEEIFRLLRAERERVALATLMNQLVESASIELYDTRYRVEDIRKAAALEPPQPHPQP